MSEIIKFVDQSHSAAAFSLPGALPVALPGPRGEQEVVIRLAVLADYPFIDALQKANTKAVGFMWEKAIQGHIEKGNVLIAEAIEVGSAKPEARSAGRECEDAAGLGASLHTSDFSLRTSKPIGYVIGVDRYLKRDELGIIYQMNVLPAYRRSLVAANLLKAKFERSAYGCRLYCCWCAQDLAANKFWEAVGFVPLAFRTGGGRNRKGGPRMHIFWQKRIRQGDHGPPGSPPGSTAPAPGNLGGAPESDAHGMPDASGGGGTAYWFPSLTGSGAIGEDRIVLPIPPGTHWSDAKPVVLPNGSTDGTSGNASGTSGGGGGASGGVKLLESEVQRLSRQRRANVKQKKQQAVRQASAGRSAGGLRFGPSPVEALAERDAEAVVEAELKAAKRAVKQAKKKFDPAQEAFARELKDRWLEKVQAQPGLISPTPGSAKYDVSRRVEGYAADAAPVADVVEPAVGEVGAGESEPKGLKAA